jgi:hypothetical protein
MFLPVFAGKKYHNPQVADNFVAAILSKQQNDFSSHATREIPEETQE